MGESDPRTAVSRRRALVLGGGLAGGLLAGGGPLRLAAAAAARPAAAGKHGRLPVQQIEDIIGADGTVSDGVLDITIRRYDIGAVQGPLGVTFTPAFEINGDLTFQPIGRGQAFLNGDLALLPNETQPFLDALLANGLVFQAFHQHYWGMDPQIWFQHFRGVGDPLALARAIRAAIDVTATPLPQSSPKHPSTPLDVHRLERILHGSAEVGPEGVVTVTVPRTDRIIIDGIRVSPEANISTNIEFKPLGGDQAWAAPDYSMTSEEVMPVIRLTRGLGWLVGCLYNQETDEHPQLYFSHQLKSGDAYQLAGEIRQALDLTDAK